MFSVSLINNRELGDMCFEFRRAEWSEYREYCEENVSKYWNWRGWQEHVALKKYHCVITDFAIEFDSEEDYIYFLLKFG